MTFKINIKENRRGNEEWKIQKIEKDEQHRPCKDHGVNPCVLEKCSQWR
jgi:hypothetical protein